MSHGTITLVVLGATAVLFVVNRFPPEVVAIGAALALYAAGVLGSGEVVAGFGDPAVAFIASLFVVCEGLDASLRSVDQPHCDGADRDSDRRLSGNRVGRLTSADSDIGGGRGGGLVLTSIATPANLMVMEPGGYRFGDYWKLGLCLMALFFVVSTLLVPLIWSF